MYTMHSKNPLKLDDLQDFIDCYQPENRHSSKEVFNAEPNPERDGGNSVMKKLLIGTKKTSLG